MLTGLGRTLTYDRENRPVTITQGGVTASFAYGPDGQRFSKVLSGSGAVTRWFGRELELLPDGTLIKQVAGVGRITGKLGAGGVREWLHRGQQASNELLTDAGGARVQHSRYLRFGALTVDPLRPESHRHHPPRDARAFRPLPGRGRRPRLPTAPAQTLK